MVRASTSCSEITSASQTDGGLIELYRRPQRRPDTLVDRVAFRATLPAGAANGGGPSLSWIDARQDNARVGNWAAVSVTTNAPRNDPHDAVWRYWQDDPAAG
jgi:hypothetical protein